MAERVWYYAKGPVRHGPVPESVLLDLRQRGELAEDDLVWTEGQSGWKSFSEVPELAAAVPSAGSPPPMPGQPPVAGGAVGGATSGGEGRLDVSAALSGAFARLGSGYWTLVLWAVVALGVQFACMLPFIGGMGLGVFLDAMQGNPPEAFDEARVPMLIGGIALSFFLYLLTYGPLEWLQTRLAVDVADGREPDVGSAWRMLGANLGKVYGTAIVAFLIILVGLVACVIPGLAAAVMLAFVYPLLADAPSRGVKATLDESWALVAPRFWSVVVLMLLVGLVPAAIAQLCGLLTPFVMPVARVVLVLGYRQLRPRG